MDPLFCKSTAKAVHVMVEEVGYIRLRLHVEVIDQFSGEATDATLVHRGLLQCVVAETVNLLIEAWGRHHHIGSWKSDLAFLTGLFYNQFALL